MKDLNKHDDGADTDHSSISGIPLGEPIEGDEENYHTYYKNPYGGTLPIGSMRLKKRHQKRRTLKRFTKLMFWRSHWPNRHFGS